MSRARAAVLALLLAPPLGAQGIRISGGTTVEYVDIQPMVLDSVPASATTDSGLMRRTSDGIIVECVGDGAYCRYYRSGGRVSTVPVLQDLELSAWGLGTGISVDAQLRLRTSLGSASGVWPLSDRHADLLAAYAQIDRSRLRVRLGRQWTASPLGYYAWDGASVLVGARAGFAAELYGGWGLAQGLSEPRTSSAISAVEDLPPDDRGYLLGAKVSYRHGLGAGASLQYQREIRTDRAALYSERVAGAGDLRIGRSRLDAAATYDLATGALDLAELRVQLPVGRAWSIGAQLRHYVPFFELWTIWGAFAPVGYDEANLTAAWGSAGGALALDARAGYRRYGDTHAGLGFLPLSDDAWQLAADGTWRVAPRWSVLGGYRIAIGYGASRSDFDAGVRWAAGERASVGVHGSAFQSLDEFSVGTGRVLGASLSGSLRLSADASAEADVAIYRHTGTDEPQIANWNQRRATLRLDWKLGRDPGNARVQR